MANELIHMPELKQIADVMGKNKLFGMSSEDMLPLMLIAQAEGKHPAIAALEYDIIQGRPAIKSKASLARFQAAGGIIEWVERSDTTATARFSHAQCPKPVTVTWTIKDAERAGLVAKDNWKKYPRAMLSARVEAEGIRACYPACLSGIYTVEETRDMEPRNVTPHKSVPPISFVPETEKAGAQDVESKKDAEPEPEDYVAKTKRLEKEIYEAAKSCGAEREDARKRILAVSAEKMANVITEGGVVQKLEAIRDEYKQAKTA